MEKLELKHLAPYLPYSLKLKGDDGSVAILTTGSGISLGYYSLEWVIRAKKCKPILRPITDLVKHIEINGIELIPAAKMITHGFHHTFWYDLDKFNYKYLYVSDLEKLLEWNFDVFGLIPKGLAVDINTLTK